MLKKVPKMVVFLGEMAYLCTAFPPLDGGRNA